MFKTISAIILGTVMFASGAWAVPTQVFTTAYNMNNGNSGSFNYWDDSYDGTGVKTADGASLTGGTGDLTDGYIETQAWNLVEGPSGPNGPYVGWSAQPNILFHFAQVEDFTTVRFHMDHRTFGDVAAPSSITINGVNKAVPQPPTFTTFSYDYDRTWLAPTNTLSVQMFDGQGPWIFVSEVEFFAERTDPVPLPAGVVLLGSALAGMAAFRRFGRRG